MIGKQQIQPSQSTASKWASPTVDSPPSFADKQPRGRQPKVLPPSFILQLNSHYPTAVHEAVNPKKICCFFCAHFWQISKCSVLDSEAKKGCRFFQTAGKTQLPKRLIVGKDRAAGKVLAGKSVIFAFCGVVGSKGRTPPAAFYEKSWLQISRKSGSSK